MRLKPRRRVVVPAKPPEAAPAPKPTLDLDAVWDEATALYANRRGMRASGAWAVGMSARAHGGRLAQMRARPAAKRVRHLLEGLSNRDLRVFHARAAINQEQAVAATRLTVLANVSVPLALVLLVGELAPGIWDWVFRNEEPSIVVMSLAGLIGGLTAVGAVIWYAYAGVHQARDLYHLATLEMARRGLAPTIGGGEQDPAETT